MTFRTARVALLLSCLSATGCGTVANVTRHGPDGGGKVPFGGVRQDLAWIEKTERGEPGLRVHHDPQPEHREQHARVAEMMVYAVDLPLSLIGDTLTLPYTLIFAIVNRPPDVPPVLVGPPTVPQPTAIPTPIPPLTPNAPAAQPAPFPPVAPPPAPKS